MRKLSEDLAHRLAAEYALGTLRGRGRSRFEAIARADPAVEAIRQRWEAALATLAERVPEVEPPARVWKGIEERIAPPAARGAWSSVGFWRSFGLLAGGVASVLLAAFLYLSAAPRSEPLFVAVLTSPSNEARMVITMHSPDALRVRNYRPWRSVEEKGMALELWALPKEGAPRSLGVIGNVPGETTLRLRPEDARVLDAKAFALSMEPPGGSPTRQPTGPVLCSGALAPGRKA